MFNTDIILKDLISQKVLGSSLAYTPKGIKLTEFISQYVKKFGAINTKEPQTTLTIEDTGRYNVRIINQNGNSSSVRFKFFHDNLKFYGLSEELGNVEASFNSETGEPSEVQITKELPDKGLVYTTATPAGFRTSYYTPAEQEFRAMGISEGIIPEMVEFEREQIDGDVYLAAYMNHEAEVAKRINSRTK